MLSEEKKEAIDKLVAEIDGGISVEHHHEHGEHHHEHGEHHHEHGEHHHEHGKHHHEHGEHHHEHGELHHEHGEHHHEHHHSHKHGRGGKIKSKIKRFFSKNKSAIKGSAVTLLAVAVIIGIAWLLDNQESTETPVQKPAEEKNEAVSDEFAENEGMVYAGLPVLEDEIVLIDGAVLSYLRNSTTVSIYTLIDNTEGKRFDVGAPVQLEFDLGKLPKEISVISATLEVSEYSDFKDPYFYYLDESYSVNIYHLKTGYKYFYRFSLHLSDNERMDFCGSFETADTPRILTIGGIRNVRDIGGWKTVDGREIKQGMLYRGTELDGAVRPELKLTDKGRNELLSTLGIRSDMDLRSSEDNVPGSYILGANVGHQYYEVSMYSGVFTEEGKTVIKDIFSDLAKPEKYPVYLHCTFGVDRTGTVCYLLEALLGVNEEDLVRDYELSGLFADGMTRENLKGITDSLEEYEGNTIGQKVENYMLSIGVTIEEIESIRNIFLYEG